MSLIFGIVFIFAVWIFIKYKITKITAQKVLINAIVMSYKKGGKTEVRYGVSDAALPMVFDMFGGQVLSDDIVTNTVTGILPLPTVKGALPSKDEVLLFVTMTQASENRLLIQATEKDAKNTDLNCIKKLSNNLQI